MADYTPDELAMLKNYKSSDDDYTPEELAQLKAASPSRSTSVSGQLSKLGKGALGEYLELNRSLVNLPPHILNALGIKSPYQPFTAQQYGSAKYLTPDVTNSLAGQTGQAIPDVATLLMPGLGEAGGAAKAGEMLKPAAAVAEQIPKGLKYLKDLGTKYAKNVATGAAATPLYSPDQSITDAWKSGLTNPWNYALSALGPVGQVGSDAYQKAKQVLKRAGGTAPTEDVIQNLEALKNTIGDQNIPPGQMIKSPAVNSLQSFLSMTPGSKMDQALMGVGKGFQSSLNTILGKIIPEGKGITGKTSIPEDIAGEVGTNYSQPMDNKLTGILDKLSGKENTLSNRGSIAQDLQKDIKTNYSDNITGILHDNLRKMTGDTDVLSNLNQYQHQLQDEASNNFKNKLLPENAAEYKEATDYSESKGEKIVPNKVVDLMEPTYQSMTDELARNPKADIDYNLYKELQNLHNIKYAPDETKESTILGPSGKPLTSKESTSAENAQQSARTLGTVNQFRKKYHDNADDAFRAGRRQDAAAWRQLWSGYTQDVEDQLSGKSLSLWQKANNSYRTKIAPIYNSPEILPHVMKWKSPDTIVSDVMKTGDGERPGLLRTFSTLVSPQSMGKMGAVHYTKPLRAVGGQLQLDPTKMLSQHDKLGNQTRDIVFSGKATPRNRFDNLNQNFDKDLFDYGIGNKPPEKLLSQYVKSGTYERPDLAEKLLDVVSPQNKGKVAALQATRGMKNLDAKKLFSNINKLDPATKSVLYGSNPKESKLLDALHQNYNPELYDYGKGNKPADDIIGRYLRSGADESPALANQLLDRLSPTGRNLATGQLVSGGRREITDADRMKGYTPLGAIRDYNKIGDRTLQSLLRDNPELMKKFGFLTHATGLYGDLNPMLLPKTGMTVAAQRPFNEAFDAAADVASAPLNKSPKTMADLLMATTKGGLRLLSKAGLGNLTTKYLLDPEFIQKYLESRQQLSRKPRNKIPVSLAASAVQGRTNRGNEDGSSTR